MKNNVTGMDVSKEKLDFCLQSGEKISEEFIVENTAAIQGEKNRAVKNERTWIRDR
jgi:hypothetical protein